MAAMVGKASSSSYPSPRRMVPEQINSKPSKAVALPVAVAPAQSSGAGPAGAQPLRPPDATGVAAWLRCGRRVRYDRQEREKYNGVGTVAAAVRDARHATSDGPTQAAALYAVAGLVHDSPEGRAQLLATEALPLLINLLSCHNASAAVICDVGAILAQCAAHGAAARSDLLAAGAVAPLVVALGRNGSDAAAALELITALRLLAHEAPQASVAMVKSGVIAALTRSLAAQPLSTAQATAAAQLLTVLVRWVPESAAHILAGHVTLAVQGALWQLSPDAALEAAACDYFAHAAAAAPRLRRHVVQAGVIREIINALKHHPGSVQVVPAALRALENISCPHHDVGEHMRRFAGVPAVLAALPQHSRNVEVCRQAVGTLYRLGCEQAALRAAFVLHGVVPILFSMLRALPDEAALREQVALLLHMLALRVDGCREQVLQSGGIAYFEAAVCNERAAVADTLIERALLELLHK